MASKVTPCVTMMICVAGCSSTTTERLPYSRDLPPPEFDWTEVTPERLKPDKLPERIEKLRAARKAQKAQQARRASKPVTVDVPIAVLKDVPPPKPPIRTQFETVPDSYFEGIAVAAKAPDEKPFFTPLKTHVLLPPETGRKPTPVKTAQEILKPLIERETPRAITIAEPIAYPQYVSVGPEYFGLDSDIAPYVISRSETVPIAPRQAFAAAATAAPSVSAPVSSPTPQRVAERLVPVPRSRPYVGRRQPPPEPQPEQRIAAIIPPRPDPEPRREPSEPQPRLPARPPSERLSSPILRDDELDGFSVSASTPPPDDTARRSGWATAAEKALSEPRTLADASPDTPVYRVRVTPDVPQLAEVASLGSLPVTDEVISPEFSVIRDSLIAAVNDMPPLPREKPLRPKGIQVAGSSTGVRTQPPQPVTTLPANDPKTSVSCLVNRGSNDRMILICEGVDVSQAQVFHAVIEGETAFRGLRRFDETEAIISAYGFNTERFVAMSQGPKSARDLAFLRALRNSGKQVQVKGRTFDLYLMKGDLNLATVLVEQVAASDVPAAVNQR